MTTRAVQFFMCLSIMVAINAACVHSSEIESSRARDLIRRNILGGEDRFAIEDPHVYQYGSVHVDGPSGGMLYRFQSNSDTLSRIIKLKRLEKTTIDSTAELLVEFLEETPGWWKPFEVDTSAVYSVIENIATGGKRRLIVIYEQESRMMYVIDHYSDMRGV